MQDKYTGDVGDFGKYILLNEIAKRVNGNIRLGINWYYTLVGEPGNTDGKHIAYLDDATKNSAHFKACSPGIYDELKKLVSENRRSIAEIEAGHVLPEATLFYSEEIPYRGDTSTEKVAHREQWFAKSMARLDHADVIFFDPDNGINLDPYQKPSPKAMKYVFTDEIETCFKQGKSLVVYNHRDHSTVQKYDAKLLSPRKFVEAPDDLRILRFKRFSVRDYMFLIQKKHHDIICQAIKQLTSPPCNFLFAEYVPGQ